LSSDTPVQDPTQRHLSLFLADVAALSPVPTLRSFLKLYTSLGAKKLANFLDEDEEEMVQELMVLKQASKSISRLPGSEQGSLLEGETITTSDLNFTIDEVSCSSLCLRSPSNFFYRTWFTSLNRLSGGGLLVGSSKILSEHKEYTTI
jgi:hypothetical protein